jgi:hypothetical protein
MKTTEANLKVVESYLSKKTGAARATPPRDYTHMVYRCHPGSIPAEQRKKVDLAGNPTARRLLAMLAAQLGTPRGRYDEHSGNFPSIVKPRFNRPVRERNHF